MHSWHPYIHTSDDPAIYIYFLTNLIFSVVRETFEVRAVSHNDFKNFENKADFITWFISCSYGRLHINSDTLDICISEDKEKRLFYNEHKQ